MKVEFADTFSGSSHTPLAPRFAAGGECQPLTDVLLCPPRHLDPVPCCAKTRESVRGGFTLSLKTALRQHRALQAALTAHGVTCHLLPAAEEMPDLCFTRDVAAATPWGMVALNPAMRHRKAEVDHVAAALGQLGAGPVRRIREGHIEGGDICIARPGLLILGLSGERTDTAGAGAFAAPFLRAGWTVISCPIDPHFLHLDTVFCMLDPGRALACIEALDEGFLAAVAAQGIELVPIDYAESRDLGGNVLSLDGRTVLTAANQPRIAVTLRAAGYDVMELDITQFAACGGGIHCLTLPLSRRSD